MSFTKLKRLLMTASQFLLYYLLCALASIASIYPRSRKSGIKPAEDKILLSSAVELSRQIKRGRLTSEQVVETFIKRIKEINPILNAVVDTRFERALEEAREIDRRLADAHKGSGDLKILDLPLVGVPISIKENIKVAGCSLTCGLVSRKGKRADKDAEIVVTLKEAGLIPIVITNTPTLCLWWDSSNRTYGRTNNPYDLSRISGGSSGGEGSLIAGAGSVIGVGNDVAGSIRIPANFCGIFGHKPTSYLVSNLGLHPQPRHERGRILCTGPMTRYAADLLPMLKVMSEPYKDFSDELKFDEKVSLKKLRIFYLEEIGDRMASKCNSDVLSKLHEAIAFLEKKFKTQAQKVYLDELKYGFTLWSAEANLHPPPRPDQLDEDYPPEIRPCTEMAKKIFNCSDLDFIAIWAVALRRGAPLYGMEITRKLNQKAEQLRNKFNEILGEDGVLLMPSHPEPAPKHYSTPFKVFNVSYTAVTSVLQAPITQCPLGLSPEGLPIGIQILGREFNDRLTIAVAECLEKEFGGWVAKY